MSCRVCGKSVSAVALVCDGCGAPDPAVATSTPAPPAEADEPAGSAPPATPAETVEAAEATQPAEPATEGRCPEDTCGEPVPAGQNACPYCGASLAGWTLQLDSGATQVRTTLRVGRDPSWSPLAVDLTPFTDISRQHLVLRVVDDRVRIEDVGSTNGTFVDGVRIRPGEPQEVDRTATVQLGRTLTAQLARETATRAPPDAADAPS
jgi:hypothetical protein